MNPLDDALTALPHGPEFRFIDRLTGLEPGLRGTAVYRLPPDAVFLRGHFPGAPLMPGVLLVEAMAQLAGVVAQSDPGIPPLRNLRLTALRQVKILGSATPGETVGIRAEILGRLGNLIQARASVRLGDAEIALAEVTLSGDPAGTR